MTWLRRSRAARGARPNGPAPGRAVGVSSAPARFAERARRVRMRPWRAIFAALALIAAPAGIWALLVLSPWLRVQNVAVVGAAPDREAIIRRHAEATLGKPLVQVDPTGIASAIEATNLFAAVDVTRSWSDELMVRVEERTPAVASRGPGPSVELIDREGIGYERVAKAPDGVPVATLTRPSDNASKATAAAVALALPADVRARAGDLVVDGGARASFRIDRVQVLWGDSSDSAVKAAALRPLLRASDVARIDLTAPMNPVTSQ